MGMGIPVDVGMPVQGLNRQHGLCNVEARLLKAQDVLAHEERLRRKKGGQEETQSAEMVRFTSHMSDLAVLIPYSADRQPSRKLHPSQGPTQYS